MARSFVVIALALVSPLCLAQAPGFPSRDAGLDVLPGFVSPPAGYGQVPFWWWSGDPLDKERLLWQIEKLHSKGITGMQVNYMHEDTPGWPTSPVEPEIFSEAWWDIWQFVAAESARRGMGIGLSGYTLDWPKGDNLFNRLIYHEREIQGREITADTVIRVTGSSPVSARVGPDAIAIWAYPVVEGLPRPGGQDLSEFVRDGVLEWAGPGGEWDVRVFSAAHIPGTLNPIHPLSGLRVIEKFFQPFEDRAANRSSEGLNYFFQDELHFGVGDMIWTDDLGEQFRRRKGYDLFEVLPALFADMGPHTPKARLDFMDVKVSLSEERYFIPIYQWHESRGKIYGADPNGRGLNPGEYGDNFRIQRWYTAPGHDTPGGNADLIKGKISSSIAALYQRPRVWLEGYHSLGWGATPERLMFATLENYLYGCNLLNLHGLYYTTHGSFWEWAPPSYHFRMPYWDHMDVFLKYFERLSYLLSQGVLQADIAVMYPVSPIQARMDGDESTRVAFDAGRALFANGHDFIFMDDQSMDRAVVRDDRLEVSGMSFKVLILPSMKAVRWTTLQKALEFARKGGIVINIGDFPEASDRAGREDPQLDAVVESLFGVDETETGSGGESDLRAGFLEGRGVSIDSVSRLHDEMARHVSKAVECDPPVRSMHRRIGPRDVFFVMDAHVDSWCTFKTRGHAEIWDPWTGDITPLEHVVETDAGTLVQMPLDSLEAHLIVFSPTEVRADGPNAIPPSDDSFRRPTLAPPEPELPKSAESGAAHLLSGDWEFELVPTMDNRWGDFRLPVTEDIIGAEARIFRYAEETGDSKGWEQADFDDASWPEVTYGFGPRFYVLGPLADGSDPPVSEDSLAQMRTIDSSVPVSVDGRAYAWRPYAFSWRMGKEGDPGHQGWHGLKSRVTDDFLALGHPVWGFNAFEYRPDSTGSRTYVWTTAYSPSATAATVYSGGLEPAALYVNGARIDDASSGVPLEQGANPILLRYDRVGRGHFLLQAEGSPEPAHRTPLSMRWFDLPGRIPLDIRPSEATPAGWYRFTAPPGLRGLTIRVHGEIQVWVEGVLQSAELESPGEPNLYRVSLSAPILERSVVAIRIEQRRGDYAGAALPEPIVLDCGVGLAQSGDWAEGSVLETYSGGAWYRKDFFLSEEAHGGTAELDLGDVVATAEVHVNGQQAGVLLAPPWRLDVSRFVRSGENRLEILVYNTLANHYVTIPSRYKGESTRSGLLGPVRLITRHGAR